MAKMCDELTTGPVPSPPALQSEGDRECGSEAEPGKMERMGLKYIFYHLYRHKTRIAAGLVFDWHFLPFLTVFLLWMIKYCNFSCAVMLPLKVNI